MNKLILRKEHIPATNELLAARAALDLRIEELERAQEALLDAENYLNFLTIKALKESSLKFTEGEVIHVIEADQLFCYIRDGFHAIQKELDMGVQYE